MKEFDSDSESQDLASEEDFVDHEDEENTEDIDFYYNGRRNPDKGRSSNSSSSSNKCNCRLFISKSTCNSSRNCEWVVNKGRMAPHCAHRNYEDALNSEDVFSEFEDYMNDEDSEEFEFESEDNASEDFAFNERSSDFFSGSKKNNCKLIKSKRTCNSSRNCKWLEAGRMMPRCAHLHYEDVFSESDDYMKDEDMEE